MQVNTTEVWKPKFKKSDLEVARKATNLALEKINVKFNESIYQVSDVILAGSRGSAPCSSEDFLNYLFERGINTIIEFTEEVDGKVKTVSTNKGAKIICPREFSTTEGIIGAFLEIKNILKNETQAKPPYFIIHERGDCDPEKIIFMYRLLEDKKIEVPSKLIWEDQLGQAVRQIRKGKSVLVKDGYNLEEISKICEEADDYYQKLMTISLT